MSCFVFNRRLSTSQVFLTLHSKVKLTSNEDEFHYATAKLQKIAIKQLVAEHSELYSRGTGKFRNSFFLL